MLNISSITSLYAQNYLYRVDTRPPEEIFLNGSQGFVARGNNHQLSMHVSGHSASINGVGDTGLISATDNLGWANQYSRRLLDWNLAEVGIENRDVYIYQIAQTRSFFNVQRSLQPDDPNINSSIRQGEWVIENRIPSHLIIGVWHLYDHGSLGAARDTSQADFLSNSLYSPGIEVGVNQGQYNGGNNPIYAREPLAVSVNPLVLLGLSATLWCRSSNPQSKLSTCSISSEKEFGLKKMIGTRILPSINLIN